VNIQDVIKSGKPFRRESWVDDIFLVYLDRDIVLTVEADRDMSMELDVQDILADDWYTRDAFDLCQRDEHFF
jgi:hypothetical protein